jgi:hypothetical protein
VEELSGKSAKICVRKSVNHQRSENPPNGYKEGSVVFFCSKREELPLLSDHGATASRTSGAVMERRKRVRFPWVDVCHPWNVGKCEKTPGSCVLSGGVPFRHEPDWRDFNNITAPVCGQDHQRVLCVDCSQAGICLPVLRK